MDQCIDFRQFFFGFLPGPADHGQQAGHYENFVRRAPRRRGDMTISQLYMAVTGVRGHRVLCGTAEQIANSMEEWIDGGAADGFNIMSLTYPSELDEFIDQVIPILQQRGRFRTEYEGRTLRENLGLPLPTNRWTKAR